MNRVDPFLKWPGGKRWIVTFLQKYIEPTKIDNYFEPFLGGGAVFFGFELNRSILSDKNEQLINTYKIVKENPDELICAIKKIDIDKNTYYKIRDTIFESEIDKAASFIYLNRLAFGGMYRVNQKGKFNVPFGGDGRSTNLLWEKDIIKLASKKLLNTELHTRDFNDSLSIAKKGDLVFCDPPYTVCHNANGFQRYNENIFGWKDQIKLAQACLSASEKGVKIIVSNAAHESIKNLYYPNVPLIVNRYSGLSKIPKSRKKIDEYLFLFNV